MRIWGGVGQQTLPQSFCHFITMGAVALRILAYFVAGCVYALGAPNENVLDQLIQEYEEKILVLEQSIREVKAQTTALDQALSHKEKYLLNCQQYLQDGYFRMAEAGIIDKYDQLISALGVTVDKIHPDYRDTSVVTKASCDREPYIAPLSGTYLSASSRASQNADSRHSYLHYKKSKKWEVEAWIPHFQDKNPWIQVDLSETKDIYAVGYAGRGDFPAYIKTFTISYSNDGSNWTFTGKTYKGLEVESKDGDLRKLARISLQREIVFHVFKPMLSARFVRLHPLERSLDSTQRAVRWELYAPKCKERGNTGLIAQRNGNGLWGANRHKMNARFSLLHSSLGWAAPYNKMPNNHAMGFDIGKVRLVNAVALQGKREALEWTTAFRLTYHNETTKKWVEYTDSSGKRLVFNGNFDQNTVILHPLERPIMTRYVAIIPMSWNNWPALRWEVYGPSETNFPDPKCLW